MESKYGRQARGDAKGYASYYAGMDKTMRQKVALISSYFPSRGRVADMGCGSGKGSFDIASLYPELLVTGVDISPESVAHGRDNFKRSNLAFQIGDIADRIFPAEELDAILNSSVLHHVTSFNSFDIGKIHQLLDHQVGELKAGGILAIRDFVVPVGPPEVEIELLASDLKPSTAELFEVFCRDFKCADYPSGGVPYGELDSSRPEARRFRVDFRRAAEFLLRKDYRADWDVELLEEYLYFSQAEFEAAFASRGLRLLLSRPIYNQWIIGNRWRGQVWIYDLHGGEVPFPPTNYMIIGQKVDKNSGVRLIRERGQRIETPKFLALEHFKEEGSGQIWDLVSRPQHTVDLIPWYQAGEEVFVLSRSGYPRPIATVRDERLALEKLKTSGFLSEPIAFGLDKGGDFETRIQRELLKLGIPEGDVRGITLGHEFLPSAGGSGEKVTQYFAELARGPGSEIQIGNPHGFQSPSMVRPLAAQQTLRAYCTGGMMDNRLEIACFRLLTILEKQWGPWIGDALPTSPILKEVSIAELSHKSDRRFVPAAKGGGFIAVHRAEFAEISANGDRLSSVELEYVLPTRHSTETLVALPFAYLETGELIIGIEERFLPAAQKYFHSSRHYCVPAWRLTPPECAQAPDRLVTSKLRADFGLQAGAPIVLGSGYMPSPGTSPETCTIFAAPIVSLTGKSSVSFHRLSDVLSAARGLRSGHLLTAVYRLAHAAAGRN